MHLELVPAYGRDSPSGKAAKEAFFSGKDFLIADITSAGDGKPCNIEQLDEVPAPPTGVLLRFKRLTGVTLVKRPAKGWSSALKSIG